MKAAFFIFIVVVINLTGPSTSIASPLSHDLIVQGFHHLTRADYVAALKKFKDAAQVDPTDLEAHFFQGVAFNRLGQGQNALTRFQEVQARGYTHRDLLFEVGWALLTVGRLPEALYRLTIYEKQFPGRGQTQEFLGRVHYGLGNLQEAEAALQEALRRDPLLAPTVRLMLLMVAQAQNQQDKATQHLNALVTEIPTGPISRRLRTQRPQLAPEPDLQKPWQLIVSAGAGFNDNVMALGDGISLPLGVSSKESVFGRFTANGSYGWALTPKDALTAGYAFLANVYGGSLSSFDLYDHFFYADLRHVFTPLLAGSFRLSDEFTQVGGNSLRNQVGVRPGIDFQVNQWTVIEMAYLFTSSNYYFATIRPGLNRDGSAHSLILTSYLEIPNTQLQTRFGFTYVQNNADGAEFEFDSKGFLVGLVHPLWWQITGELVGEFIFADYDNLNSLSRPTPFAVARDDNISLLTINLSRPITNVFSAFVRYDYTRNSSNIPFYDFDQNVVSGGVVMRY